MEPYRFMCDEAVEEVFLPLSRLFYQYGNKLPGIAKFRAPGLLHFALFISTDAFMSAMSYQRMRSDSSTQSC